MMAYINCKRNKDTVHIDSAGNHPMTITIQQAGKLHTELTKASRRSYRGQKYKPF